MLFLADLLRLRPLSSAWFGLEHHLFCKVDRCILSYVLSFKIVSKPQSPWTLWRPCHKNMSSLNTSSSSDNSVASSFRKKNVEFVSMSFAWNHCLQTGNTKTLSRQIKLSNTLIALARLGTTSIWSWTLNDQQWSAVSAVMLWVTFSSVFCSPFLGLCVAMVWCMDVVSHL